MATVEEYKKCVGKYQDGRPKYKTHYMARFRDPVTRKTSKKRGFTRKDDAKAYGEEVEHAKRVGEYIAPSAGRVTVGELGPAWLQRQGHLKPSTYRTIDAAWRNHVRPRWGDVAIADVVPSDVQAWTSQLTAGRPAKGGHPAVKPKSATVVIRAYGVLAGVLDDAVKDRRAARNPARGVKLPRKGHRPHTYLSHEQVDALAREAGEHGTLVLVLAYCGIRWGEAVGLRVRHLDMLRRRLLVEVNAVEINTQILEGTPKGHRKRTVPFPAFLAERLAAACEGKTRDALVFEDDGRHVKRSRHGTGWFTAAWRAAGVPELTPHDLRHTAASLAVSSGANVKAVQKMLGHASAAMTLDTYADLFDDDLGAVADALDDARRRALGA